MSTATAKRTLEGGAPATTKKAKTATGASKKSADAMPTAAGNPVQIVMDDTSVTQGSESQQTPQQQQPSATMGANIVIPPGSAIVVPGGNTITKITPNGGVQISAGSNNVQKVNWRFLAQDDNFARMVTVSDLNPKTEGCYVNFNARLYERETGERFSNKATRNALTIEGPWMKCVTGLHDTKDYPGSYSMMLSGDNYDADEDVGDFVEFMERVVDGFFKTVIAQRANSWMKNTEKYQKHDIVTKHKETKNQIYAKCWQDGSYTEEQYETDVMDCIKPTMRQIGKDGNGAPMLFLKVYPVKDGAQNAIPVRPDIVIFNSSNQVVPFAGCKISEKGATYVKPVFTISRVSFAKEKFHITPCTSFVKFKTVEEIEGENVGTSGQQEIPFTFDGEDAPVTLKVERRKNAEVNDTHGE